MGCCLDLAKRIVCGGGFVRVWRDSEGGMNWGILYFLEVCPVF